MNNLHRELAPISDAARGSIEDEARRTFSRDITGRRVVDVVGPAGPTTVAQALTLLPLVGVGGPYSPPLSAGAYTAVSETTDHGYPVLHHLARPIPQRREHRALPARVVDVPCPHRRIQRHNGRQLVPGEPGCGGATSTAS